MRGPDIIPNDVYEAAAITGAEAIVYFDNKTRTVYIQPDDSIQQKKGAG